MMKSRRGIWTLLFLLFVGGAVELSAQAESENRATAPAMTVTDTADISNFFPFGEDEEVKWKYQFGTSPAGFIDFFLSEKRSLFGSRWHVRVRTYSTGVTDTILYRRSEDGVYHINVSAGRNTPSMTLPSTGWIGREWFEYDMSWSYTITSLSATLESERMNYENLLVVRSVEQKPKEGMKPRIYDLFFAEGIGMIATVVDAETINTEGVKETTSMAIVRLVEAVGLPRDQG